MSLRIEDAPPDQLVELDLDGQTVLARRGEPVASALIAEGEWLLGRSVKYHRPRAAFCLAGSCGSCLVRIDGRPNVRACRTAAEPGMKIERQNAYPSAALDVFGATDFVFPRGMDHHTFLVSAPRPIHAVMQKIARQLAGLGRLPDPREVEIPPARDLRVDLVVVGAGPAGLSAAIAAAGHGGRVLILDEQAQPGGSLLADPRHGLARARDLALAARQAGVELLSSATVLAYYPEDRLTPEDEPGLLAVSTAAGLLLVKAARHLYATGSYDQNALFPDNDVPGVLSARAVGRLLVRDRILPARRAVVLGAGPYARLLTEALLAAGAEVTRVDGIEEEIVATEGHRRLRAVRVARRGDAGKRNRKIRCELLAVAALPAPATELLREHGCRVTWQASLGGFHVPTDAAGRTSVAGVYAAGDVAGFLGVDAALEAGARIGEMLRGAA